MGCEWGSGGRRFESSRPDQSFQGFTHPRIFWFVTSVCVPCREEKEAGFLRLLVLLLA